MRFLDLGCGTCSNLYPDCEIYGIDINQSRLEKCYRRFPKGHFQVWDIRNRLPFPDKYFDIVRTKSVLIYIKNVEPIIKEMKRVGKEIQLEELYSPSPIVRACFPKYYLHNYPGMEMRRTPKRGNFLWDRFGYKIWK